MRNLFMWTMVFGIFAGLNVRVMGSDHVHPPEVSHGCDHHHDQPEEVPDTGDCQPGNEHEGDGHHHHHDCCTTGHPLTVEHDYHRHTREPGSSRLGVRPDREIPPDEPILGSEKPPLI